MRKTGARKHGNARRWGRREQKAGSICELKDRRKEEGGVGGNSSRVPSSTKIVPATWQESVQMSPIQVPRPFPYSDSCQLVRLMNQRILGK